MSLPISRLAPVSAPNAYAFTHAHGFVVSGVAPKRSPLGLDGPTPTITLPVVGAVNVAVAVLVAVLVLFGIYGAGGAV